MRACARESSHALVINAGGSSPKYQLPRHQVPRHSPGTSARIDILFIGHERTTAGKQKTEVVALPGSQDYQASFFRDPFDKAGFETDKTDEGIGHRVVQAAGTSLESAGHRRPLGWVREVALSPCSTTHAEADVIQDLLRDTLLHRQRDHATPRSTVITPEKARRYALPRDVV